MKYKIYSNTFGDLSLDCEECKNYRKLLKPYTIELEGNLYLNSLYNITLLLSILDTPNFETTIGMKFISLEIIPKYKKIIINEQLP